MKKIKIYKIKKILFLIILAVNHHKDAFGINYLCLDLNYINQIADKNTLIVFDDKQVLTNQDKILHPYFLEYFRPCINFYLSQLKIDNDNKENFLSEILLASRPKLVDQNTPNLIAQLKKNGCKSIGISTCLTGKFGKISSLEDLELSNFNALGLNFSTTFPEFNYVILNQIIEKSPFFKYGFLFTYDHSKEYALFLLLFNLQENLNWLPKKIIYIDDRLENLQAVEKMMLKNFNQIEYIGLEYAKATYATPQWINIIALKNQIDCLFKHKIWLNDNEISDYLIDQSIRYQITPENTFEWETAQKDPTTRKQIFEKLKTTFANEGNKKFGSIYNFLKLLNS